MAHWNGFYVYMEVFFKKKTFVIAFSYTLKSIQYHCDIIIYNASPWQGNSSLPSEELI